MRLWLNHTGKLPLREQLFTQVRLGILCNDLLPGQRLPSTRELARRFSIHPNTASAAYRALEREGWVEFRHGSGVYVRAARPRIPLSPELAADQLIGELVTRSRKRGISPSLLRERLRNWLVRDPPACWLLIEPNADLRQIVALEMEKSLALPVTACAPEDFTPSSVLDSSIPVVLPSKAEMVRNLLPAGVEPVVLQVHPVAPALDQYLPAPSGVLIGIASHWQEFRLIAHTMLVAAGFPPESLLKSDASRSGWKRGLAATAAVVCDTVTSTELPKQCRPIVFHLVSEDSLAQMRELEAAGPSAL